MYDEASTSADGLMKGLEVSSQKIWLIGGTTEGRQVAELLNQMGRSFALSVATALGEKTYQGLTPHFYSGRLDAEGFEKAFLEQNIDWVIDASHPHATDVSKLTMTVCAKMNIRYTRFDRNLSESQFQREGVLYFNSFEDAFLALQKTGGNIFLTGSKELGKAVLHLPIERLAARIAPSVEAMTLCEQAGILSEKIIAMKGPFDVELNRMMLRHFQIHYFVFKESGAVGGYEEKIQAALLEKVTPVVIEAPKMNYPERVKDLEALTQLLEVSCHKG